MVERIAGALQIDPPELFSVKAVTAVSLRNLQKTVLQDIEKAVGHVVLGRINEVKTSEEYTGKDRDL
jgi:hypothetical protein